MDADKPPRRVVIVGGGFAGLYAARALRRAPVSVILIDRAAHHLFQPLLYQCATGILSEGQIASPLRLILRRHKNVETLLAEAVDVDPTRHMVIALRPGGSQLEVPYDDLVLTTGVRQSYFGHEEFAAHAPGMKTIGDALAIRQRVFGAFEQAETAPTVEERRKHLTFALVGAGPTGVELAGQIRELATHTLRNEFHRSKPEDARVLLFDGGEEPLKSFGPKLSARAAAALTHLGVELHMNSRVTNLDATGLTAQRKDGSHEYHEAGTILWTAGVAAPPLAHAVARACGVEQDRSGRIKVQPDLTVHGHPDISVAGDLMSLDQLPGVAEVAMQAGHYTGTRIRRAAQGHGPPGPFTYRDLGSAAYVARGRAVVMIGRLRLSGFLGWLAWLLLHIAFLTGYRNRLFAIATWLVAFTREVRPERAFTTREIETARNVYAVITGGQAAQAGTGDATAGALPHQTTTEDTQASEKSASTTKTEQQHGTQPAPRSSPPRDTGPSGDS